MHLVTVMCECLITAGLGGKLELWTGDIFDAVKQMQTFVIKSKWLFLLRP